MAAALILGGGRAGAQEVGRWQYLTVPYRLIFQSAETASAALLKVDTKTGEIQLCDIVSGGPTRSSLVARCIPIPSEAAPPNPNPSGR